MASNRRIRGDCGSVGTPIPRDPENQADFPTTPILPLIESPNTDSLFTWARNMTLSLEDWFNLLSQAVYDGDDQLTDLYECYCIRLCATVGTACKGYECDALDNYLLSLSPDSYYALTNGLADIEGGAVAYRAVVPDLMPAGNDLLIESTEANTVNPLYPSTMDNCSGTAFGGVSEGASMICGLAGQPVPVLNNQSGAGTILLIGDGVSTFFVRWANNAVRAGFNWGIDGLLVNFQGFVDHTFYATEFSRKTSEPEGGSFMALLVWEGYANPTAEFNWSSTLKVYDHTGLIIDTVIDDLVGKNDTPFHDISGVCSQIEINPENATSGVQNCFFKQAAITDAEALALVDSYNQNFTGYQDPNPDCITSVCKEYECDAVTQALVSLNTDHAYAMLSADPNDQDAYNTSVVVQNDLTGTGPAGIHNMGNTGQGIARVVPELDTCLDARSIGSANDNYEGFTAWRIVDNYMLHQQNRHNISAITLMRYAGGQIYTAGICQPFYYRNGDNGSQVAWRIRTDVGKVDYLYHNEGRGAVWTELGDAPIYNGDPNNDEWFVFIGNNSNNGLAGPVSADYFIKVVSTGVTYSGSMVTAAVYTDWYAEDPVGTDINGYVGVFCEPATRATSSIASLGVGVTINQNIPQSAADTLIAGYERTKATYVDPDPNCGLGIGVSTVPTPVDSDMLVYNEACGGWTFEQRPRGTQVYFQINEPVEAVEGDFWSTTVSQA